MDPAVDPAVGPAVKSPGEEATETAPLAAESSDTSRMPTVLLAEATEVTEVTEAAEAV